MPNLKQVGRELGVRYVLEGSVRKAGGRVRITAQLIDALSGTLLWADRFDGRPRAPSFGNSIAPEWRGGGPAPPPLTFLNAETRAPVLLARPRPDGSHTRASDSNA